MKDFYKLKLRLDELWKIFTTQVKIGWTMKDFLQLKLRLDELWKIFTTQVKIRNWHKTNLHPLKLKSVNWPNPTFSFFLFLSLSL
jgi:hypothetical protein